MAGLRFRVHEGGDLGLGYKFLATFPKFNDYVGFIVSRWSTCCIFEMGANQEEGRGGKTAEEKEEEGRVVKT